MRNIRQHVSITLEMLRYLDISVLTMAEQLTITQAQHIANIQGLKVIGRPVTTVGIVGDDFVRNQLTAVVIRDCYRIPRILNHIHYVKQTGRKGRKALQPRRRVRKGFASPGKL